jgi:hypothetical protein
MPGVESLLPESGCNPKAAFIMGHSLQTVAVLPHMTGGFMIGLAACGSRSGEPVMNHASKNCEGMTIYYFRFRFLEKRRAKNSDKECLKITPRTMRAMPARIR